MTDASDNTAMEEFHDANGIFGFSHLYPSETAYIHFTRHHGFLAAVNVLLQFASYTLIHRGHFFVDYGRPPFDWAETFDTPTLDFDANRQALYPRRLSLMKKWDKELWRAMRDSLRQAARDGLIYDLPEIGFKGDLESLVAKLSRALFNPVKEVRAAVSAAGRELGLDEEPYGAFHVRRGDKVGGYIGDRGKFSIEGEFVSLDAYVNRLRAMAPTVSKVFLMTDDYSAFEEATAKFPELKFVTLCSPSVRGFDQTEHNASDAQQQLQNRRDVVRDIAIARDAAAFVGVFRSNVSCFIHLLRGQGYERSASVDSAQRWNFI